MQITTNADALPRLKDTYQIHGFRVYARNDGNEFRPALALRRGGSGNLIFKGLDSRFRGDDVEDADFACSMPTGH